MLMIFLPVLLMSNHFTESDPKQLEFFRDQFHNVGGKAAYKAIIQAEIAETDSNKINTIQAYKAVCESMMAQYSLSPFAKMKHFKKGTEALARLIEEDEHIENIYLRLLLQLGAPKMLNYDQHIESDIRFLARNIGQSDLPLIYKKVFINTLLESNKKDHDLELLRRIKID